MEGALLDVRELKKHFQRERGLFRSRQAGVVKAVDGVSFTLAREESLGLVGESGSGKSTTARTIVGLLRATSGSIRFDGTELTELAPRDWRPMRSRIQMIFQDPYASLDPRQTVASILEEPLRIQRFGKPRARALRILALLEAVGLSHNQLNLYPHEFSGGQRQRIGIARALALEPELIVCDEPVSALDVSVQSQILNLLQSLQRRFGLSYLFIAHDLAAVQALCSRIAVMVLGRIVELAPREELFARPRHPYTQALLSAVPIPDPEVESRRERIVLHGDVPNPHDPPSGCAFHPRCALRDRVIEERCARETPALEGVAGNPQHLAACHYVQGLLLPTR